MSFGLGFWAAAGGAPTDYELISTSIVGSGGIAGISFASLPQTYKHLQVRFTVRPTSASYGGTIYLNTNGGASPTGYNHSLYGNGSSVISSANANPNLILGQNIQSNDTTGSFNGGIVDILDYASTAKNKTFRWLFGYTGSIGNRILLGSSNWSNTAAINELYFSVDGNLAQFTRYSLYGIKG
jgi:hypothetical protein